MVQPASWNTEPGTRNMEHGTWNIDPAFPEPDFSHLCGHLHHLEDGIKCWVPGPTTGRSGNCISAFLTNPQKYCSKEIILEEKLKTQVSRWRVSQLQCSYTATISAGVEAGCMWSAVQQQETKRTGGLRDGKNQECQLEHGYRHTVGVGDRRRDYT